MYIKHLTIMTFMTSRQRDIYDVVIIEKVNNFEVHVLEDKIWNDT